MLLETIADQIPEGQTMTAPTTIGELSTLMGYQDQAARRGCPVLMEVGVIRIVDGGQGKKGCYELLLLPGAGAGDPALPLKSSALIQAVPATMRRRRREAEPDLFDPPMEDAATPFGDQTANNFGDFVRSWVTYFGDFVRSTGSNFGDFVRSWVAAVANFVHFVRSTSYKITEVPTPLDMPRARVGVVDLDLDQTPPPAFSGSPDSETVEPDVGAYLDWWTATFPAFHRGVRFLVDRRRDGAIVRELLAHGYTITRLQAMAIVLWQVVTDGAARSDRQWIAEVVTVRNFYVLKKKAVFLDQEVARQEAAPPPADDVWSQILDEVAPKIQRFELHKWFADSALVQVVDDVIEVRVPSDDHARWIQKNYGDVLRATVDVIRPGARVVFIVLDERRKQA